MLTDDTLRQLAADRRREREREAGNERLAPHAKGPRARYEDERVRGVLLGHLVATRSHALR